MRNDRNGRNDDLSNSVVLVTGGSRGIGQTIATELAAAGAQIAVAARSTIQLDETVALIQNAGGQALAFTIDVTDEAAVVAMVNAIEARFGRIDVLVNNAGIVTPLATIWEADSAAWWKTIDINLRGAFLCSKAVLPNMIRRRSGRIVNLVSGASIDTRAYFSAYGISKTALQRFTETLALETEEYGIYAFGVDPGWVRTEMTEHLLQSPLIREKYPMHRKIYEDRIDHPPQYTAKIVHTIATGKADKLSGRFISVLLEDIETMIEHSVQIKESNLYTLQLNHLPDQS